MSVRVPWNTGVTETDNDPISLTISDHEGLVGNLAVSSNPLQCGAFRSTRPPGADLVLRAANGLGRTDRDGEPSKCVVARSAEGDAGPRPARAPNTSQQVFGIGGYAEGILQQLQGERTFSPSPGNSLFATAPHRLRLPLQRLTAAMAHTLILCTPFAAVGTRAVLV